MRVKVRFLSDVAQPAMFVDLRWLPRPGETVDLAYRKTIEVVEVIRIHNDKRCDAVVRGKLKDPVRKPAPVTTPAPSPGLAQLGSKSLEELVSLYRNRLAEAVEPSPA